MSVIVTSKGSAGAFPRLTAKYKADAHVLWAFHCNVDICSEMPKFQRNPQPLYLVSSLNKKSVALPIIPTRTVIFTTLATTFMVISCVTAQLLHYVSHSHLQGRGGLESCGSCLEQRTVRELRNHTQTPQAPPAAWRSRPLADQSQDDRVRR
jgi:hypothetical protein